MPETSSSTRTRSTASRTIRRWSNASSIFSSRTSETGTSAASAASVPRDDRPDVAQHGEVRDRDDVHARVAPGIAVGAELGQQARGVDAGLLGELAPRRLVQRLVGTLEPAGNRPHALERLLAAADEQHVEHALGHGQDDDVDRDGEGRELRRVVAGGDVRTRCSCHHDYYRSRRFWSCRQERRRSGAVGLKQCCNAVSLQVSSESAYRSCRPRKRGCARASERRPAGRHRARRLPDRVAAGLRRHERRLPGRGSAAQAEGRAQAARCRASPRTSRSATASCASRSWPRRSTIRTSSRSTRPGRPRTSSSSPCATSRGVT